MAGKVQMMSGQPAEAMVGIGCAATRSPTAQRVERHHVDLAVALLLAVSAALPIAAWGEPQDPLGRLRFHIPSQSLGSALEAYARIAGREALYDGSLIEGLDSAAVEGAHAPTEALRLLLDGTGLVAEFPDTKFFILRRRPQDPPPRGGDAGTSAKLLYYGRIQARLKAAFCDWVGSRRPNGRIAARFWITPGGRVANEARLTSTGHPDFDQAIDERLRNLAFGPPPSGLRQPVTILVTADGAEAECAPVRPLGVGR